MIFKVPTGFREDQYSLIDEEELHIVFYLFTHPEARHIFKNGTMLIGSMIKGTPEPAWNEIKGWNPTHKIDGDDMNEIRKEGLDEDARYTLQVASDVAQQIQFTPSLLKLPLEEAYDKLLLIKAPTGFEQLN